MSKFIFSFFLLFSFNLSFSQYSIDIKETTLDANILESRSIHIFNEDSDILLTGDFLVINSYNSIWLEPRNNYSITIKPNDILASKIGITDDDEERPTLRVSIQPSPTSNTITITLTNNEDIIALELYNNYGAQQTNPVLEPNNVVNFINYANGIYLLLIRLSTGEVLTTTLIKN